MNPTSEIVDKSTIDQESYYNLCRIQDATHHADPIAQVKRHGMRYQVTRDECGNICTVSPIPETQTGRLTIDEPFIFLDLMNRPYKVQNWGDGAWLFYWNEGTRNWVSLRRVEPIDIPYFKQTQLSEEEFAQYP